MKAIQRLRALAGSLRREAEALREDADAHRSPMAARVKRELASELERDARSALRGAKCLEKGQGRS